MAVGDTLPHCTGTGTELDPYIYTTAQGFLEAIAVYDAYVEAGQNNLKFNANDGIISTLVFCCTNINGKGTTITNMYLVNTSSYIIQDFDDTTRGITCNINNVNFYNMCFVATVSLTGAGLIKLHGGVPEHTMSFNNCNFSGIIRGGPRQFMITGGGSNGGSTLTFSNCTFNFNLNTNSSDSLYLFGNSYTRQETFILSNCTIKLSGYVRGYNSSNALFITYDVICDNCTFMNDASTPLYCDQRIRFIPHSSTYNYVKLYINTISQSSGILDFTNSSATLLNKSRLANNISVSGCIQMQETDPTASDYIYDVAKLQAAGFLVGQVIN